MVNRKFFAAIAVSCAVVTSQAQAGGVAEPLMEPEVIAEETAASGGFVVPLLLLVLIAAAISGGSGGGGTSGSGSMGSF